MKRLNYIGSKFQLLDWITESILEKTGWDSVKGKRIADLFSGTGVVSYHFRLLGSEVHSNDTEKYSAVISHALTKSRFTQRCREFIERSQNKSTVGYMTREYSPYEGNQRMFFTVENAMKIDGIRETLESEKDQMSHDEFQFLLASLVLSADAVSNVPAVYGCYLKNFKKKALKTLDFQAIHENTSEPLPGSTVYNRDVSDGPRFDTHFDAVYLDPPYNERQYSKNYFPLNMIVQSSSEPLKGKTGIPVECFVSPFCKKTQVEESFQRLLGNISAQWVFLSYSSESLIPRDKMIAILASYGTVTVKERDYKRFKSFEYNDGGQTVQEYLFCLQKFKV